MLTSKLIEVFTIFFSIKPDLKTNRNIKKRGPKVLDNTLVPKDALITRGMSLRREKVKEQRWLTVLTTVFVGNSRET